MYVRRYLAVGASKEAASHGVHATKARNKTSISSTFDRSRGRASDEAWRGWSKEAGGLRDGRREDGKWRCQAERGIPEEDVHARDSTTDFAGGFGCGRSQDNGRAETKEEIREGSSPGSTLEIDAQRRDEFTSYIRQR